MVSFVSPGHNADTQATFQTSGTSTVTIYTITYTDFFYFPDMFTCFDTFLLSHDAAVPLLPPIGHIIYYTKKNDKFLMPFFAEEKSRINTHRHKYDKSVENKFT